MSRSCLSLRMLDLWRVQVSLLAVAARQTLCKTENKTSSCLQPFIGAAYIGNSRTGSDKVHR